MTSEQSKISTEDETRLIFDAARASLGDSTSIEHRPRPEDAAISVESPGEDERPAGVEVNSSEKITNDPLRIPTFSSTRATGQVEPELPIITVTSVDLDQSSQESAATPIEAAASPRLRESPREALRRLQQKVETARSEGLFE